MIDETIDNDLPETGRTTRVAPVKLSSEERIDRGSLASRTRREEQALKTVIRDAWSKRVISVDPQLVERMGRSEAADNSALGNDPARLDARAGGSRTERLLARVTGTDAQLPDMAGTAEPQEEIQAEPAPAPEPPREDITEVRPELPAWAKSREEWRKHLRGERSITRLRDAVATFGHQLGPEFRQDAVDALMAQGRPEDEAESIVARALGQA